jgi:hypothetical protein
VPLGIDRQTGVDRGSVQFATAAYVLPAINDGPQWLARVDHYQSEAHRLSWRYSYDSQLVLPGPSSSITVPFPGFVQENTFSHHNFLFADSYTLGPSYTNEFRFSYGRPDLRNGITWPGSIPLARTLPRINFPNPFSSPGLVSSNNQFHYGNNFLFQETQTKLSGRHAFRYGMEFLRQVITQQRGSNDLGMISYTDAVGYSAFANFLDDFSGPSGITSRVFGAKVLHPDQFRQTYFLQDNWKATPTLALTLGLRYENFGQFANALPYPAFSGFDPSQFLVRHEVNRDNTDFGPAFGFAWSPSRRPGCLGRLFGDGKTVWRGGYQISYDALFTQLIFLGPAGATPNAINTSANAPNTGRGRADWFEQVPTVAAGPGLSDSRTAIDKDLRNPYTERWSFGFQRQLPQDVLLDVSYVGSESHRLTTKADVNPQPLNGNDRLYRDFGPTDIRTSEGNSTYHALQARLDRRFASGFQLAASYTWSKFLDSTSEGAGNLNIQQPDERNLTSVPIMQGGLKLDRGLSDFDRPQRLTIAYLWAVPGPRSGWCKYPLGGWSVAGITTFQSGTPFTVANGSDRNNDAIPADRPDIGNPSAPLNSWANIFPGCPTGYQNPDTGACVSSGDVHWVEGRGFPNASTVGRNTLRTGGMNNFDLTLSKSIRLGESRRLELGSLAMAQSPGPFSAAGNLSTGRIDLRSLLWQSDLLAKSLHARIATKEGELRKRERPANAERSQHRHAIQSFKSSILVAQTCESQSLCRSRHPQLLGLVAMAGPPMCVTEISPNVISIHGVGEDLDRLIDSPLPETDSAQTLAFGWVVRGQLLAMRRCLIESARRHQHVG